MCDYPKGNNEKTYLGNRASDPGYVVEFRM